MFEILSRLPDRDIYIITKSPSEQYSNSKNKVTENDEEIKHLSEYKNTIMVFDDNLVSSICKYIHQFFKRGRHNKLDIGSLSQSYFDVPKISIRNNSNKIFLFN